MPETGTSINEGNQPLRGNGEGVAKASPLPTTDRDASDRIAPTVGRRDRCSPPRGANIERYRGNDTGGLRMAQGYCRPVRISSLLSEIA